MNTPTERAALAASDHYARRLRHFTDELRAAPWTIGRRGLEHPGRALEIIDRARAAELRDPAPAVSAD